MAESKVDLNQLQLAWEDDSVDTVYYLDKDTGCVELVHQGLLDLRDLTDEIECHRQRYLYIPKPAAGQLRQDILDFIGFVDDPGLKRLLEVAQESPNVLFAIKTVLSKSEKELKRFENFRASRVRIRIKQWLAANFIDEEGSLEDFSPP